MRKFVSFSAIAALALAACSGAPAPETSAGETGPRVAAQDSAGAPAAAAAPAASAVPASYKDIAFPEFRYVAPYPKDFRVQVSDSVTGYVVVDRSLPLVNFTVFFDEPHESLGLKDEAASSMVGAMFRRGGAAGISARALDDSLEFVSAGISTSTGTFTSSFDIDCLSKDFPAMLALAKKIVKEPAFDKEQLEIVKANFVTSYDRRYDTPGKVLQALQMKVNYVPSPRLWDANAKEYSKVSVADVKRLSKGLFSSRRIIFALSGDIDRDSAVTMLKEFFADLPTAPVAVKEPPKPLEFLRKPGVYVVDRDITQANIVMNQPFVRRPHPDYYPAAVASFILGGGSFSSRLMNRVRSDEGLAYSVYSAVGNEYRDTALTTIALQTKVETVDFAIKLVFEEVDKLAKEGPTDDELAQAKKSLVESLPSLFDSPEATAVIFAKGELLGKTDDHYLEYVKEINAVTAEQVKAMIAKYFSRDKMTISIVGPVAKFDALKPFTVLSLDSLEFR